MKTIMQLIALVLLSGMAAVPATWGVTATPGSHRQEMTNVDMSSGFYGGIQKGNKLLLILSEQGGVRYYDMDKHVRVINRGAPVDIVKLPLKTPIVVRSESGRVVEVDVQEVGK